MNQRPEFLKGISGTLVGAGAPLADTASEDGSTRSNGQSIPLDTAPKPALRPTDLLNLETMRPHGQSYQATVPDTLDLAERAELVLNPLLGDIEPSLEYSLWNLRFDTNPPQLVGHTWNLLQDNVRVLPLMRTICGSERGLELEYATMNNILRQIHTDGAMYYPISGPDSVATGTSYPLVNSLAVFAAANWYERDRNAAWLDVIQLMSRGLERMAIQREERAYYPLESGYSPDGIWHWTLRGKPRMAAAYTPPDEPVLDFQGDEGAVKFDTSNPMRAILVSYQYTKDAKSLEMAQRLSRFLLKPGMWRDTGSEGYLGNEHGIFVGHFRNNTTCLIDLLDLAVAEKSEWLKQFVREGYDHTRRNGVTRMGWFPSWVLPQNCGRPESLHHQSVTDDMPMFAVKLSDAGLGDYWDDVDYYVRNQFIEQQVADIELMRQVSGGGTENDALLQRFVGGFTHGAEPTALMPWVYPGNVASCALPMYYAWHGITRFDRGVATVNLFLNRASAWMDVDSYLPYEGRVVLHNKTAHTAAVRIPGWLEVREVKCFVNDRSVEPPLAGRYLLFVNLSRGDKLRLEFSVPEWQDHYTIDETRYTISFRGSTVVDISPRTKNPKLYPSYRREHMKGTKTPQKTVQRFVADNVIPLL